MSSTRPFSDFFAPRSSLEARLLVIEDQSVALTHSARNCIARSHGTLRKSEGFHKKAAAAGSERRSERQENRRIATAAAPPPESASELDDEIERWVGRSSRARIERHLADAKRHSREAVAYIDAQHDIIDRLTVMGADVTEARKLLSCLEIAHALALSHAEHAANELAAIKEEPPGVS